MPVEATSKDLATAIGVEPSSISETHGDHEIHFVRRGQELEDVSEVSSSIDGYDPELMSGRTLLTAEEEKKLLRKIDWRLMTLCSIIFMFKNLDSANVRTDPLVTWCIRAHRSQTSNARIMNKGTNQNIITQLGMTSNEYSLVTVAYYVMQMAPKSITCS